MVVSRRTLVSYGGSVGFVILATLLRYALDPILGDRGPMITYFFGVAAAATLGGSGPGLVALVLGGLASDFFFTPPRGSFWIKTPESMIGVVIYLLTGLTFVVLAESQRRALKRAEASSRQAIERQAKLEAEIVRREQVEGEHSLSIAEQSRLRAIAEEQSATFVCLLDQAPFAIVFYDTELRHVWANEKAPGLIGMTPSQVSGRTLREILDGQVDEARIVELEAPYRQTLETGEPFFLKAWDSGIRRTDGSWTYLDWSIRRVDRPEGGTLGLLGIFADVTEDIARGQALRLSEERFRLAAEAVNGLIYDANFVTGHVERTRGLFELLGWHPDEVPPTLDWWLNQVHPDDLAAMLASGARRKSPWSRDSHEYRVRHRDGHYLNVVDRHLADVDPNGQIIRHVGCTQDVTEIRQAEAALREADRRKNDFLAVLAHEIRNPLASIRNSLRLMKLPGQDGQAIGSGLESERETAERQVGHLARLVDDLMDVSRITRGRIELRKEPIELARVVERAVDALRPSVDGRGHVLTVDLPSTPIRLEADPTRIEQVIGNLLSNAVKYTPPGGRISVSAREEAGEVALTVTDNGLGIAAEMLPAVFEMFVQDGTHSGHAQGGLGIGLGLSKNLVELHGGRISARSPGSGLGCVFEVRLPLAPPITDPSRASDRNGHPSPPSPSPRRRVLVVDDNEDVAKSLGKLLQRMYGQEVRVAHDGPSALALLDEYRPELILLDIGMPGMDGCEVARRIRLRPEFDETLLIALTGWGQDADRKRTEEAGIDRHLVKPVDPDILGELIASAKMSRA